MSDVLLVASLWLLFGGSHVALATRRVREALASRFGERAFTTGYVLVASSTFAALVAGYSSVRFSEPPGIAMAAVAWARAPLFAAAATGIVFMVAALAPSAYWESPAAILQGGVRQPRGLERITRHPFFTGTALWAGSHALLSMRLTGTVFFAGFVVLVTVGPVHQARKLCARKGEPYVRYLESTSAIPFVAILRGRQRLVFRELPWAALALGAVLAYGVWQVHDRIFAWYGAPLIAVVVGGGWVIDVISLRRARRVLAPEES
jgi:uncharacterized membrane protein